MDILLQIFNCVVADVLACLKFAVIEGMGLKLRLAAVIFLISSYGSFAQQLDTGEVAFRWSCAPCHGVDGKGDGLPPDLTTLAKKNGGKFPARQVYEIVQESWIGTNIRRHMPIMGFDVRSRSTAIVEYLRHIQEK